MNEQGERAVKTLAKHVKDLRKLWYLEHEQNRKLVEMMHNSSGQSRSRSMRRSVLPCPQDTSSLNLSTLSIPAGPKDPLSEALPCFLRLPLKSLRSAFTRLIRTSGRPWARIGRVWRGIRRRRLGAAVKEWRLQAGISGLVRKVNVDLSFIRGFDRLDVFFRCKQQFFIQFCLFSLSYSPQLLSYAEASRFSHSLSKIITRRAFRKMQVPVRLSAAASVLLLSRLRSYFHLFRSQIRIFGRFKATISRFASILTLKELLSKSKALALLETLERHRKGLSTAASLRSSPEKARLPVLWGICGHIGAVLRGALAEKKRFAMGKMRKYRRKSVFEIAKLVRFALILDRKAAIRLKAAIYAIKATNYREKANFLSSALQNTLKKAHFSLYSTAWQVLLTHYEAAVERRQGIEGLKSVFDEILTRKSLKQAWGRLKFQAEIKQLKGKMLGKCLNRTIARIKGAFLREIAGKQVKMSDFGVKIAVLVVNFAIKRQFQAVFPQLKALNRLSNPESQCVFSRPQQTFSRFTSILVKLTAQHRLRALLHWRSLCPCPASHFLLCWQLSRCLATRQRAAFGRLRACWNGVEVESGLVCLDFSVEAVIRPKRQAQTREAWELLRSFAGHQRPRAEGKSWEILICCRKILENRLRTAFFSIQKLTKRMKRLKKKTIKTAFRLISLKLKQQQAVSFTLLKERTSSPVSNRLFTLLSACLSARLAQGLASIRLFAQPKHRHKAAGLHYLYRLISTPTARVLAYSLRQVRIYAYNEARYRTYLSASPLLTRSMFAGSVRNDERHRKSPEFGFSRPLRTLTTSLL